MVGRALRVHPVLAAAVQGRGAGQRGGLLDIIVNGPYTLDIAVMGLVDENNAPNFYDGKVRVVDVEGTGNIPESEAAQYAARGRTRGELGIPEVPVLKTRGWKGSSKGSTRASTCATPLARLNVADRMASAKRARKPTKRCSRRSVGIHAGLCWPTTWARLVEMVQNAETLQRFCDDPEITGDEFRVIPQHITGEGIGMRRGHARDADAPLHLRREAASARAQPHRRHDQQQRAHSRSVTRRSPRS